MELKVPCLNNFKKKAELEQVSAALNITERHTIQQSSWLAMAPAPKVSFSIAYTEHCILLKYFVQENAIRTVHFTDNSPVHEDSCVEFFIAFNDDTEHYNLEFNSAGTCLAGFGENASQRKLISKELVKRIRRHSTIQRQNENGNSIHWELTLIIPFEVFAFHEIKDLKDRHCRINFYKCGDKLPEPHFLAWKEVKAESPDFHLPQFFGMAYFQ